MRTSGSFAWAATHSVSTRYSGCTYDMIDFPFSVLFVNLFSIQAIITISSQHTKQKDREQSFTHGDLCAGVVHCPAKSPFGESLTAYKKRSQAVVTNPAIDRSNSLAYAYLKMDAILQILPFLSSQILRQGHFCLSFMVRL